MIKITPNYLTPEECSAIIASLDSIPDHPRYWSVVSGGDNYPDEFNLDNRAKKVFAYKKYCGNLLDRLNLDYTTAVEVLRYPSGTCSPVHVDGSGSHNDSSLETRLVTWKKTRIVLLNTDFTGGELFFPNIRLAYGHDFVRSLIEFPAGLDEYCHGVDPVENGVRYTLVFRD
jgi:hypothetical protein